MHADTEQLQNIAINNFLKLRELAARLPGPAGPWLFEAIDSYINQPIEGQKPFDYFLGLSGRPGQRLAVNKIRLKTRDFHLLAAAKWLQQKHGCSLWSACGLLAEAIKRFRSSTLVRLNNGSREVNDLLEQHLLDAFRTDMYISTNQHTLYRIAEAVP